MPEDSSARCISCETDLPENSRFCLNCGHPIGATASAALASLVVRPDRADCRNCGASLPDGAEFCLNCGLAVNAGSRYPASLSSISSSSLASRDVSQIWKRPRRSGRVVVGIVLASVAILLAWCTTSQSPRAHRVQDVMTWPHTESVIDKNFSVSAQSFSSYKINVPKGASGVKLSGQFGTSPSGDIEVYLLTDDAFVDWRNGFATRTFYESGRVTEGQFEAELPPGVGSYYLIFSNKISRRQAATVQASATLHYYMWWP